MGNSQTQVSNNTDTTLFIKYKYGTGETPTRLATNKSFNPG